MDCSIFFKNINSCIKLTLCLMIVLLLSVFFFVADINLDNINVYTWLSLIFFVAIFTYAMGSERFFWKCLPFAVISTPNAINDLWPSEFISIDYGAPTFSLFTHVDIYLFFGIIFFCDFNRKIKCFNYVGMLFFLLLLSLVIFNLYLINMNGVLFGLFQLRYFLLLLILVLFSNPGLYQSDILRSFCFCLILVIVESLMFSFLHFHNTEYRLTSGNFGVNSYGHILAAGLVMLLSQRYLISKSLLWLALCFLFFFALIATGTRFSLVVIPCSLFLLAVIKNSKLSSVFFIGLILLFLFVFSPLTVGVVNGVSDILNNLSQPSDIPITPETSSIITRLTLWNGTLDMISDYSFLGVGPGGWGMLKNAYGITFDSVYDPHQDILNYIVAYGFFFGFGLYFFIFIKPHICVFRHRKKVDKLTYAWLSIITCFLIAGLSNAVTWKHQIAVFLYLSSFMVSVNIRNALMIHKKSE